MKTTATYARNQELFRDFYSLQDGMTRALAGLDSRSQAIVRRRWLGDDKATLHDLADEFKVSAERIRQIEAKALDKMRKLMGPAAA